MNNSIIKISLRKKKPTLLLTLLTITFLISTINSWSDKSKYGTPDLRNRIVGSRVLKEKENLSPYFYKWNKADGDRFLDMYDSPEIPMNRNTVTPFITQILTPFCSLNYTSLSKYWYITEIAALLLILIVMTSMAQESESKLFLYAVSFIEIGLSQSWTLHNTSGQVYIFFPLLFTLLFYFSHNPSLINNWLCVILLASLVLMRPPAALFILPFLLQSRWNIILPTLSLILTYFISLYLTNTLWVWTEYVKAMNLWSKDIFHDHFTKTYLEILQLRSIEGSNIILQSPKLNLLENSSIQSFFFRFFNIQLTSLQLLVIMSCFFIFILTPFVKRLKSADLSHLFLITFLLYFVAELCLPAIRNSYNAVQWIFPLSILYLTKKLNPIVNLLMGVAAIFTIGWLKFLPFDLFIAELLFALAIFVYLSRNKQKNA